MPKLKKPTEEQVQGFNPNEINETQYMLKDLIEGDTSLLKDIEGLDMDTIKKALDFLTKNEGLDEKQKLSLIQDS